MPAVQEAGRGVGRDAEEPGVAEPAMSRDVRRTISTPRVWDPAWADDADDDPPTPPFMTEEDLAGWQDKFRLLDDETLAGALAEYETVAAATDELVRTLPDLGATHPLPTAPWFPPNARWSARRVLLHIIAETAQHCGHADIIRESIDGQKTMG